MLPKTLYREVMKRVEQVCNQYKDEHVAQNLTPIEIGRQITDILKHRCRESRHRITDATKTWFLQHLSEKKILVMHPLGGYMVPSSQPTKTKEEYIQDIHQKLANLSG